MQWLILSQMQWLKGLMVKFKKIKHVVEVTENLKFQKCYSLF